jgi:hypothetical protein
MAEPMKAPARGKYAVERVLAEGVVVLRSGEHGSQIFTRRKARKPGKCENTGEPYAVGAEIWGTLNGSTMNRMDRVLLRDLPAPPDPKP